MVQGKVSDLSNNIDIRCGGQKSIFFKLIGFYTSATRPILETRFSQNAKCGGRRFHHFDLLTNESISVNVIFLIFRDCDK